MSSYIILIELDLTAKLNGIYHRYTNAMHDVNYLGHDYVAAGNLLSFDDIEQSVELASVGTVISLSGIDPAYQAVIDKNAFLNAPVRIYAAKLEEDTNVITDAVLIHNGRCSTPTTSIDYANSAITVSIITNSIWGDLEKTPNLARTSYATHSSMHSEDLNGNKSADKFFQYVASTATEEKWYKKT